MRRVRVVHDPKGNVPKRLRFAWAVLPAAVSVWVVLFAACNGGVIPPISDRFGQIGHVTVTVTTPLRLGAGNLRQQLTWKTSGEWRLHEEISYRGEMGDAVKLGSVGDPSHLSPSYAELIVRLHEAVGLSIFIPELPEGSSEECGNSRSAVELTIHDDGLGEDKGWQQCVDGSLSTMSERGAGPLPTASRLVAAGIQVRDATIGPDYRSPYYGSIPFGTIAKGDNPALASDSPVFIESEGAWSSFWDMLGSEDPRPWVDFANDYVIAALVGKRKEAGHVVAVRNIFQTGSGTFAGIVERIPGDFCSPFAATYYPFHLVVAPRTVAPRDFVQLPAEYVSCDP